MIGDFKLRSAHSIYIDFNTHKHISFVHTCMVTDQKLTLFFIAVLSILTDSGKEALALHCILTAYCIENKPKDRRSFCFVLFCFVGFCFCFCICICFFSFFFLFLSFFFPFFLRQRAKNMVLRYLNRRYLWAQDI